MTDWFDDLRTEKQQAIAQLAERTAEQETQQRATRKQLLANHARILATVEAVQIETLLLQFFDAALRDHPLYPNPVFARSITTRTVDLEHAQLEPAPWSGPLADDTRLQAYPLPEGHYVTLIIWKIRFEIRDPDGTLRGPYGITTSLNAQELAVNGQPLATATSEALAAALTQAFRNPPRVHSDAELPHARKRRHHQRPWYKRLLRSISSPISGKRQTVTVLLVAIVLLACVLGVPLFLQWLSHNAYIQAYLKYLTH